jgi:hypothetical protein
MQGVMLGIVCWISISLSVAALWAWLCLEPIRRYSQNFKNIQLRRVN